MDQDAPPSPDEDKAPESLPRDSATEIKSSGGEPALRSSERPEEGTDDTSTSETQNNSMGDTVEITSSLGQF